MKFKVRVIAGNNEVIGCFVVFSSEEESPLIWKQIYNIE